MSAMQPYMGTTTGPVETLPTDEVKPQELEETGVASLRADLVCLLVIVLGFAGVLLAINPQHDYPIIDDWIYSDSVQSMLQTGQFTMPDQSQANLAGLIYWGAAWTKLFGFSISTLTYSTLALVLAGLLAFYGICRLARIPPAGALLAVGLLAANPLFLHLSYSFMTDVPFLALMLIACYFYMLGLRQGARLPFLWLVLAGLTAGWAFLIRQLGALIPAGFFLYLVIEGLPQRRWRWKEGLAVALVPGLIVAGWWLLMHDVPPSSAARSGAGWSSAFVMKEAWLRVILLRILYILPLAGLSALAALKFRRARLWLVGLWIAIVVVGMLWSNSVGETWLIQHEPPFTFQLGPISIEMPRQAYAFGGDGNIVRVDGIDFYEYTQQSIWTPEVWHALFAIGAVLGALLLAKMTDIAMDGLGALWRRWQVSPVMGFYLAGLFVFAVTVTLSGTFFDRYLLALLPFLLVMIMRGVRAWGRMAWTYSIVALVVLFTFSAVLKLDAMDHTNARWQAATWLTSHGTFPGAGYDYNRGIWAVDRPYQVADVQLPNFRVEATFPYLSRLSGFTTRYVIAQSREDTLRLGK
jgi:4-amino-4-deoxy-L-arabinose transferase-like glycosyltransferase